VITEDISLDRAALGFIGKRDLANPELSTTKRKELDQELRAAIENQVNGHILPKLKTSFESVLGKEAWTITPSPEPHDEMTLLFSYPSAFAYKGYMKPSIRIEFGRGEQQPSETFPIAPFVAEEFADVFSEPKTRLAVLDCERTFWEKVTLLHAENHRPDPAKLKPRMSRHWSDVAVMSTATRFINERLNLSLLDQVIAFKSIYFAANWAHYDTAVPGTLSIVPNNTLQKILRDDYKQMREMFPDEPLSFDDVLGKLETLQQRIHVLKKPA